jgi:transposase-like protein
MANEPGKSIADIAREIGISEKLLSRWRKEYSNKGILAFPGKGIEALTDEQRHIRDLEAKLRDAEMERDILKKAVAIFSKAPR